MLQLLTVPNSAATVNSVYHVQRNMQSPSQLTFDGYSARWL